jgi:glycosyltransferase involved in cell wall biosynthesis
MTRVPVLCTWSLGSISGWDVYGLNLAQQWANDPDLRPIFIQVPAHGLPIDPLRAAPLVDILRESSEAARVLSSGRDMKLPGIVIHALGNGLRGSLAFERIKANAQLAAVFFDDTEFDAEARARASKLELIVTGSSWNTEVLRGSGIGPTACVLQGVDPTLFHPAPASGLSGDRFLVFSGGKLEPRKGQDLVLRAFKIFAARHPEALLVTAWHSPWPRLAAALGTESGLAPVPFSQSGYVDVVRWAVNNGLKESQVMDIGLVPNWFMPTVLRETQAALFMNRCEGGTNLVAMECMACGVPTILPANTGHLDLLQDGAARALERQGKPRAPAGIRGIDGWGESDVEEAADALEAIYVDRAAASETSRRGAALLAGMSWARQTARLKNTIRRFLSRSASDSSANRGN